MRVLIVDPQGSWHPFAISLQGRGHDVQRWGDPETSPGFIPVTGNLNDAARWADLTIVDGSVDMEVADRARSAGRLVVGPSSDDFITRFGAPVASEFDSPKALDDVTVVEVVRWWNGHKWVGPVFTTAFYAGVMPKHDGPITGFWTHVMEPRLGHRLWDNLSGDPKGPYRGPISFYGGVWPDEVCALHPPALGASKQALMAMSAVAKEDPLRWWLGAASGLLDRMLVLPDRWVGGTALWTLHAETHPLLRDPREKALDHVYWDSAGYDPERGVLAIPNMPIAPVAWAVARGKDFAQVHTHNAMTLRNTKVDWPLWRQDQSGEPLTSLQQTNWFSAGTPRRGGSTPTSGSTK